MWRGVVHATAVPRTSPAPIRCGRGGGGPSVSLRPRAAEHARQSGAAPRSRRASRRAAWHRYGSGDHPHRLPWEPTSHHTRPQHSPFRLHQRDARSTGALLRRHAVVGASPLRATDAIVAAPYGTPGTITVSDTGTELLRLAAGGHRPPSSRFLGTSKSRRRRMADRAPSPPRLGGNSALSRFFDRDGAGVVLVQRTCNGAPVASTACIPVCGALFAVAAPGAVGYGW